MSSKKYAIITSGIIGIVSIFVFVILQLRLYRFIGISSNDSLLSNLKDAGLVISGGCFTSSFVTLLISIKEYQSERKKALEKLYFAAYDILVPFMGTYPFLLNEPFELVKNCLGEIDNNNFYQSFNESVYEEIPDTPEELLLPIEDSAKREIWIERGGPEACVLSTLIHELTHAWQAEHVNMDKLGIQIIEGHSTFVEIECLRKLGQFIYTDFWEKTVLNRNDDYSKGLQYWKSLMQSESDKNIFVILSAAIIAAGVLFIVFKLNHKDNEPSSKIYFDYPQSENVVTDKKAANNTLQ